MKTFKSFPDTAICPICGTCRDEQCFLVPIDGTQEGNNIEAAPVHVKCITGRLENLQYNKSVSIIYIETIEGE